MKKLTEKQQQALIAKQYQEEVNKLKLQEIEDRNKWKERQAKYMRELNTQVKERNKKNTYAVLMSEHERR